MIWFCCIVSIINSKNGFFDWKNWEFCYSEFALFLCISKMYKKLWLGFFLCVFFVSFVDAAAWNLPGVNIITRDQRWANESWRYSTTSKTERDAIRAEQKEAEMNQLIEEDIDAYMDKQRQVYEAETATEYLIDVTPQEQTVEEYREMSDGNYLKWPESIHKNKNKIIIHHTAMDYTDILTWGKEAAVEQIKDIYKYHTFTNGRWDIGYNFLIDPFGNVYEGRAWGEWVVWAHVSWNNTPSVWISLMGNYNDNVPTDVMLKSLVNLTTALAKKYKINPKSTVTYFKRSTETPYLKEYTNYAVAGHTDAGVTSCPGTNVYNLLPEIREQVAENLSQITLASTHVAQPKPIIDRGIIVADRYYSDETIKTFTLPIRWNNVSSCTTTDTSIIIRSCSVANGSLFITLEKAGISWLKTISAVTDEGNKKFSFMVLRENDLDNLWSDIHHSYMAKKWISPTSSSCNKISSKIYQSELSSLVQQPINVLLYELSVGYPRYEVSCDGWCLIQADDTRYTWNSVIVEVNNGFVYLNLPILEQPISPTILEITSLNNWLVRVNNYTRKSYAGVARNSFRGSLIWKKDTIKLLSSWKYVEQAVVTNRLPFASYMKGVAETSDSDHPEKQKTILLLAKMYALFYINGENNHPSIPEGVSYQAIDNPDMFQKYVWAGRESTSKTSPVLLNEIVDDVVLYNGYIPILPYFSCSAGFTRSAKEKRWRSDTPYLQSKLDFGACFDFSGHGVGLSGKWAQYLAEKWRTLEQILQYYYPGVEIQLTTNN